MIGIDANQQQGTVESQHDVVSADVARTVDHLRANRTTEREAADLRDAATRSLADHNVAKSLGR